MFAMKTAIHEESSVAGIDGESTSKNTPNMTTEDAKERGDRLKAAGYFRLIEAVEEAKTIDKQRSASIKPSFIKDYSVDKNKDWTENHFFYEDGKEDDECKVLFTSYQVKRLIENCSTSDAYGAKMPIEINKEEGENTDFYYIQAQKPCNTMFVPNIPKEGGIHDSLVKLRKEFDFDESYPLEDVLDSLSEEEIKATSDKYKVDELPHFAKTWRKSLVDRDLMAMLKPIFDWQGGALDKNMYELVLGLGHVRMIYAKNKHSEEQRILNAPLIEVPVDVDDESLKVVPLPGGRLKWNEEVKAALLFTEKGKHKKILNDFQTLVANGDPMDVKLGSPESFLKYVEKASQFSWSSQLKEEKDVSLHELPEKDKIPVLTTEWCLFVRQKRSNIISNDAREIANAIEENKLNLSLPCCSLLADANSENNDRKGDSSSLPFRLPLPASKNQLQVIKNIFSKKNTVTIIRGPPGTGKTQTGLNIASIVLQRGGNCLVTSDNPRALGAFEQKLPKKLSYFCINMSTMQEHGISELSQAFDRMEVNLLNLRQGQDGYENDIERIKNDLAIVEEKRRECMGKLEERCKISRGLMEKIGFRNLVKHGLGGGAEICPHIIRILQHHDLDGLQKDLTNLFHDQCKEEREPDSFELDESENVTQGLIDLAEKNAMPPKCGGKRNRVAFFCSKDLFKLGKAGRHPKTEDDWARVVQGLKVKKSKSDFDETHVKALLERGCPGTLIYKDGKVRQRFKDDLTDLQMSVHGVKREDLGKLLQFLDDVSINRKLQESQRDSAMRIRQLNDELVFATIARNQSGSITNSTNFGNFSKLKEYTSRMKESEVSAKKASDFKEKFKESLGCVPLLLMTTEQVSKYIPIKHHFQMVIADEASQSPTSTALTILARCSEQAVIIGDTKQGILKDNLSEESRSAVEKCKGGLKNADQFLPGDGNNLFEACLQKFAGSQETLRDHFRCPPDGMSWSNKRMYSSQMNLCKPSRTHSTKELIITKNPNEDMAQYVYGIVKEALSSGTDNHAVLTIGVIMMGPRSDVKNFKDMLDEKLSPLENQYGTEAVDRHDIKVATAEDFQGDQRDIILIGCVSNNVPYENNNPERLRKWNVATGRHKEKSVIFSRYSRDRIKKGDYKQEIFFDYDHGRSSISISDLKEGEHDIRSMAEENLVVQLDKWGYKACRNEAALWTNALSIGLKDGKISDNCALIAIENYGETLEEWHKIVHEQAELEEAGITCLRVDALALSLHPKAVFGDVSTFLKEKARLSPPTNLVSDESGASGNPNAKLPSSSKQRKRPANVASNKTAKRGRNC